MNTSRIHKKQLTTMDNVESLSDSELREALKRHDISPGPITDSTRNVYRKKLASILDTQATIYDTQSTTHHTQPTITDKETAIPNKQSTIVAEASSECHSTDPYEDSATNDGAPRTANWSIIYSLFAFLVALAALYLYSSSHLPSHYSKTIALYSLIVLVASPVVFAAYRIFRFYRRRVISTNQKVCELVHDALDLLQSPQNPKGLMPILHIRDTLITPSERNSKKTMDLWNAAVKFVEQHESRVKVEMVNIDGEDFRAWKWIGSRKACIN